MHDHSLLAHKIQQSGHQSKHLRSENTIKAVKFSRDHSACPDFQREQTDTYCLKANYYQKYIFRDYGKSSVPWRQLVVLHLRLL